MRAVSSGNPVSRGVVQGWVVVSLPAESGWHNFAEIREQICCAMRECQHRGLRGVIIDFSVTALIDTSALVSVIRSCVRAQLMHCRLRLVVPALSLQLRHLLQTIGLAAACPVYPCVNAAIRADDPPRGQGGSAPLQQVLDAMRMLDAAAFDPMSPANHRFTESADEETVGRP
jgi:anti-anti-sigma regulatory factor